MGCRSVTKPRPSVPKPVTPLISPAVENCNCTYKKTPKYHWIALLLILLSFSGIAQAQVPVSLLPNPRIQFFDGSGQPLAGGLVYTYVSGSSTPLATYVDATGTSQNTNPIVLDSGGFGSIWLQSSGVYRIRVTDASGTQQWVVDGVTSPPNLLAPGPIGTTTPNVIEATYFLTPSTLPALSGIVRLSSNDQLCWRNNANSGDVCISKNSSDVFVFPNGIQTGSVLATSVSTPSLDKVTFLDGTTYPFTTAGLTASIAAACNGTLPGKVVIPPLATDLSVTATITIPSNCVIQGPGKYLATLQASAALNASIIEFSSASNSGIFDLGVDGNWISNLNPNDGITISGSSGITVRNNLVQHTFGNGINVTGSSSNITIDGNETGFTGAALPSSAGAGIILTGSAANMVKVKIQDNWTHDGNQGIVIFPPTSSSNVAEDIVVSGNRMNGNADDGFQIYSPGIAGGGYVVGPRVENNEAYCNGWTSGGTGFSSRCTAGHYQTGSSASSSGVGFDFNSPRMSQPVEIGNRAHDNVFEGFANTPQTQTVVNTSGTTVTWVSGDPFNTNWQANQEVIINGVAYAISSISGALTTLTLGSTAGTQTGVQFVGAIFEGATITGNSSYNNGSGGVGPGFYDQGTMGNTYSGNVASYNNLAGFSFNGSTDLNAIGDVANANDRNTGVANQALVAGFCIKCDVEGFQAYDDSGTGRQVYSLYIASNSFNGIYSTDSTEAINNLSTTQNQIFQGTGKEWLTPLCTAGGGTYCVAGGAGAGSFTFTLPPINGIGAISGSDGISAGVVTLSAGTATHTFTVAYTNALDCAATDNTALNPVKVAITLTGLTFTGTGTDVVTWVCYPTTN